MATGDPRDVTFRYPGRDDKVCFCANKWEECCGAQDPPPPMPTGWVCPRCWQINNPDVLHCDCNLKISFKVSNGS